jgi:phosphate uptake regulator
MSQRTSQHNGRLVRLVRLSGEAVDRAARAALAGSEVPVEPELDAAGRTLGQLYEEIEAEAAALLDSAGPPIEPRVLVAEVHVASHVQRLAETARGVGDIAWVRRERGPLPEGVRMPLSGMAELAVSMLGAAADLLATPRAVGAADLHDGLNEMAQRQRLLYERLLSATPAPTRLDVVDTVLLGGAFDRCAAHAVAAARHLLLPAGAP